MSDPLSSPAPKLAFLADLREEHRVAWIGSAEYGWWGDLRRAFGPDRFRTTLDEFGVADDALGLVVVAPGPAEGRGFVTSAVREAARRVRSGGSVLLAVRNALALRSRIRANAWRSAGTVFGFRRALRASTLAYREFLPVPGLRAPEEFVASDSGEARRTGGIHRSTTWLHDGYLYLAARPGVGVNGIVEDLASGTGEAELRGLRIGRFDLRHRGLLVLLLEDHSGSPAMVCRVAGSAAATALLDYANNWLPRLRERLPSQLSSLVPRAICFGEVRDRSVSAETRLPGIIAWKTRGDRAVEGRAARDLTRFLHGVHGATVRGSVVDAELLDRLIAPVPEGVRAAVTTAMRRDIGSLLAALETRLRGQEHRFVWAHGDFGYGNALVDPATGALTGVIDWDTARDLELAGVDLANFILQRHRIRHQGSLQSTFESVGPRLLQAGPAVIHPDLTMDGWDARAARAVLAVAFLRFFQRSARYPAVFAEQRADLLRTARWCERILGAG